MSCVRHRQGRSRLTRHDAAGQHEPSPKIPLASVNTHALHLGAERDGTKPWLGTYYLAAVYSRALLADEVLQNYAHGDI